MTDSPETSFRDVVPFSEENDASFQEELPQRRKRNPRRTTIYVTGNKNRRTQKIVEGSGTLDDDDVENLNPSYDEDTVNERILERHVERVQEHVQVKLKKNGFCKNWEFPGSHQNGGPGISEHRTESGKFRQFGKSATNCE